MSERECACVCECPRPTHKHCFHLYEPLMGNSSGTLWCRPWLMMAGRSVHAYVHSLPRGKRQGQTWWKLALGPLHYRNQDTMGCISAGSDEERLLFRITHGRTQGCLLMSLPPWRQAGLPPAAFRPVITLEAAGSTPCSHGDGEEEASGRSHAAVWKWRPLPLAMFPFHQEFCKTENTAIKNW